MSPRQIELDGFPEETPAPVGEDGFRPGQQVVIIRSGRNAVVRRRLNEHGYEVKPYGSRRLMSVRNNEIRDRYPS